MKTTVIYHSADFDGIFCRKIASLYVPDAEFIGWNFCDPAIPVPEGQIYVLDLPVDKPFGWTFKADKPEEVGLIVPMGFFSRIVWIDHHKSAIESHPADIMGYRIDGVAACRLAWQWFRYPQPSTLPTKESYVERRVAEPLSVRLAGEYDVWDKRDPRADTFQFALRAADIPEDGWWDLFQDDSLSLTLLSQGAICEIYQRRMDAEIAKTRSFTLEWEGLRWLAINAMRCNSKTFEAATDPAKHDALLGFYYNGKVWTVSMYHAPHGTGLDLSTIAVKYNGGGHKGACGFTWHTLPPFLENLMHPLRIKTYEEDARSS